MHFRLFNIVGIVSRCSISAPLCSIKTWFDKFVVKKLQWPEQRPDLKPTQHLWDYEPGLVVPT